MYNSENSRIEAIIHLCVSEEEADVEAPIRACKVFVGLLMAYFPEASDELIQDATDVYVKLKKEAKAKGDKK